MFKKMLYTNEMFVSDLKKINSDITLVGECTGFYDKTLVRHTCGYEWETKPYNIIKIGCGCPRCSHAGKNIKSQEDFIKKVAKIDSDIEVLGEYKGLKYKVKIKRKSCGHEYDVKPDSIYDGYGCPFCSSRKLLIGFNDIATTAPWMINYLADKEDAHRYMCRSGQKIMFKCPDCGTQDEKVIGLVYAYGYACHYCSDGISYPNKFGRALLKQLPIDGFVPEYTPEWSKRKSYDNYFEYNGKRYILEMDGGFHYIDKTISKLKNTTYNDKLKNNLALEHGLIMIRVDCRKSEKDYIVNNVKNSLLNELFDLSVIDWQECERVATSNFIKEACLYYEAHKYDMANKEIAKIFCINENTLKRYRDIGERVGWCSNSKEDLCKRLSVHNTRPRSIPIDVYDSEHNFIGHFDYTQPCADYMNENYNQYYFSDSLIRRARLNNKPYHGFYFVNAKEKTA